MTDVDDNDKRNRLIMKEYLCIRAHHMMCLAYFKGKGYSEEFTVQMAAIKEELKNDPVIQLVCHTDSICTACPNNKDGICTTEKQVMQYDRQVLSHCNLAENDIMRYSEIEKMVYSNVLDKGKREEICGDCEWNELCRFEKNNN